MVYANDLSEREILAGIRAGNVFIDLQGTRDRMLELTATLGKTSARMGDNVNVQAQETIEFSLRVAHAKGDWIEVIRDGEKTNLLTSHYSSNAATKATTTDSLAKENQKGNCTTEI